MPLQSCARNIIIEMELFRQLAVSVIFIYDHHDLSDSIDNSD